MPEPDTPAPQDQATPAADPAGAGYGHDEPRFHTHWHVTTALDDHGICQGVIKDISIKGATLFLDHNLEKLKTITLQIQVPPLEPHTAPHLIEVDCHIVYSIHDSDEQLFRTGIHFTTFRVEADHAFLENRLLKYEIAAR